MFISIIVALTSMADELRRIEAVKYAVTYYQTHGEDEDVMVVYVPESKLIVSTKGDCRISNSDQPLTAKAAHEVEDAYIARYNEKGLVKEDYIRLGEEIRAATKKAQEDSYEHIIIPSTLYDTVMSLIRKREELEDQQRELERKLKELSSQFFQ